MAIRYLLTWQKVEPDAGLTFLPSGAIWTGTVLIDFFVLKRVTGNDFAPVELMIRPAAIPPPPARGRPTPRRNRQFRPVAPQLFFLPHLVLGSLNLDPEVRVAGFREVFGPQARKRVLEGPDCNCSAVG